MKNIIDKYYEALDKNYQEEYNKKPKFRNKKFNLDIIKACLVASINSQKEIK